MSTSKPGKAFRIATLLLTYAIKAIGLISAANQLLLRPHFEALPLEVSAFMMAGAQVSEGLILAIIDRLADNKQAKPEKLDSGEK